MRTIDAGVRDVVALLNAVPGVSTRASCEGKSGARSQQHHADLAYVLLQYPMPLALQDFLVTRLGAVARIERDGVYSRWPARNHELLSQLTDAVRAYQANHAEVGQHRRVPLAALRSRLARRLMQREPAHISLCATCNDVVVDHPAALHAIVPFLHIPDDLALQWFAEFVARAGNRLDPQLMDREGLERLVTRTHRGDFGSAFYRRWLRYRSRCLAHLTTHQLRLGVEAARRHGNRINFYFDGAHAHFAWDGERLASCDS